MVLPADAGQMAVQFRTASAFDVLKSFKARTAVSSSVGVRVLSAEDREVLEMSNHATTSSCDKQPADEALKPLAVTIATARRLSGLGNTTIWALIKAGRLEAIRVGRRRLVVYRSLEMLLTPVASSCMSQPRHRGRLPKRLPLDRTVWR